MLMELVLFGEVNVDLVEYTKYNYIMNSLKKYVDTIFFQTAICAEASQSCVDCRAKSDILLAIPSRKLLRNGDYYEKII